MQTEFVISGMSGRFPKSENLEEYWYNLINGTDMVCVDNTRWPAGFCGLPRRKGTLKNDLEKFDAEFFKVNPKAAVKLDPQIRQLLEVTYEAIFDSGTNPEIIRGSDTGVFVGASAQETFEASRRNPETVSGYNVTGSAGCMIANRISYAFDLHGPSLVMDTYCSSSMMALHQALTSLKSGQCSSAIVAGCNLLLNPMTSLQMQKLGTLSPDGKCSAFDASANGYVRSEAIVAIFIQKKEFARKSYASLIHSKANADGYKENGVCFPSGKMQQKLMEEVYRESKIDPEDVFYIEAHGTGTAAGDPQEINAIANVFTPRKSNYSQPLLIGSTKSNVGHAEPAASLCAVVKICLAIQQGLLPANLHFINPNPEIPSLIDGSIKVVTENTLLPWKGIIGLNSTGIGGSNIHVILQWNRALESDQIDVAVKIPRIIQVSGRTRDNVEETIDQVKKSGWTSTIDLLHGIHEHAIPGHQYRGFLIKSEENSTNEIKVNETASSNTKPELWYVLSGMGSQWAGMAKEMIRFREFEKSLQRSSELLKPFGIDLIDILVSADEETLPRHKGLSIISMGIALIDLLKSVNIIPDGLIAHSAGEYLCGYADGSITSEEALLSGYFKDECMSKCVGGAMAAVGLTWEEITLHCPPGIYPACHNSRDNVTVAGPEKNIEEFIQELTAQGIFARKVPTGGVAYHSPYVETVSPVFHAYLKVIMKNRRVRSKRWISTSVPDWENNPLAETASDEYLINNFKAPVYFYETLKMIPENAVVVEVSGHALFQSILKKSLPKSCSVFGLMKKNTNDNVNRFLAVIGELFNAGFNPKIKMFYPQVTYPLNSSSCSLTSLVKWNHDKTFALENYIYNSSNDVSIKIDIRDEKYTFLAGHCIDGRLIFPATGYLVLVWKKFAAMLGINFEDLSVEFTNVKFLNAIIIAKQGKAELTIVILESTGVFQVFHGNKICASGVIQVSESIAQNYCKSTKTIGSGGKLWSIMQNNDVYKELRLRGYHYNGIFKGINKIYEDCADIAWNNNWISFLDALFQFPIISMKTRSLYLPSKLRKLTIHPQILKQTLLVNGDSQIRGWHHKINKTTHCSGVTMIDLKTALAPRRKQIVANSISVLEKYEFIPYIDSAEKLYQAEDVFKIFLDIVTENSLFNSNIINIGEMVFELKSNSILFQMSELDLFKYSEKVSLSITAIENSLSASEMNSQLNDDFIKILNLEEFEKEKVFLLIFTMENILKYKNQNFLENIAASGFLMVDSSNADRDLNIVQCFPELKLVAVKYYANRKLSLFRKQPESLLTLSITSINIDTDDDNYEWVKELQKISANQRKNSRIFVYTTNFVSGILGLINCLREETSFQNIRCLVTPPDQNENNVLNSPKFNEILETDLLMNVFNKEGTLGSYRHLKLEKKYNHVSHNVNDEHDDVNAFIDVRVRGDLSTLCWVEMNPFIIKDFGYVDVHFASLNFRDIMLAIGKLSVDALPGNLETDEGLLGLEYAGVNSEGEKVMGVVAGKGLATKVLPDQQFMWNVPASWTLEEAATVPIAYSTAYYALVVRGGIKRGESILIHSGSGGVGQAAIAVAISLDCTVYTTVGTDEKKTYLLSLYTQLSKENILFSRDTSFENEILTKTNGRGVDLVLNSLSEEKLHASIRCLAKGGRFLEIGKFDLFNDTDLGMSIFLNNIVFHGILLDALFDNEFPIDKKQVVDLLSQGIIDGVVRPLTKTVFSHAQVEEAFRFMAGGKHMGKVVIKIKDDISSSRHSSFPVEKLVLRTYFDSEKVYIIIGGLGGFGLEFGDWMIKRGCKKLILVSRSGITNGYQQLCINRWKENNNNIVVETPTVNMASLSAAENLMLETKKFHGEIGGIFNLAMTLQDALFENQTKENFVCVSEPKLNITKNLDKITRKNVYSRSLNYFVVFSSVSSGKGNIGQANYGWANSVMERICENRRLDGLAGLAIQWGAIGDVGVVQEHIDRVISSLENPITIAGTTPQGISSCLNALDGFLRFSSGCCVSCYPAVVSSSVLKPKHGEVTPGENPGNKCNNTSGQCLSKAIHRILGINDPSSIRNKKASLTDSGLDSLMAIEVKQLLEQVCTDRTISLNDVRKITWQDLEDIAKNTLKN